MDMHALASSLHSAVINLVGEVRPLGVPGIKGWQDIPAAVDSVNPFGRAAVSLNLKSVEQQQNDALSGCGTG
jgi:hypothetical protein